MSLVTNLILTCSCCDEPEDRDDTAGYPRGLAFVHAWCTHEDRHYGLKWPKHIDNVSGGCKHLECGAWAWGANYLHLDEFLEVIQRAPWERPDEVQVFVKEQEADRFSVFSLDETREYLGDGRGWIPIRTWDRWGPPCGDLELEPVRLDPQTFREDSWRPVRGDPC